FFLQAEDGIRYRNVTGVQTCALPILVYDGQHGQKSTSEKEESVGDTDNKTQSEDSNVALEKLNSLIGLDKVKKQVKEFINLNIINQKRKEQGLQVVNTSMHSLFLGNPGT